MHTIHDVGPRHEHADGARLSAPPSMRVDGVTKRGVSVQIKAVLVSTVLLGVALGIVTLVLLLGVAPQVAALDRMRAADRLHQVVAALDREMVALDGLVADRAARPRGGVDGAPQGLPSSLVAAGIAALAVADAEGARAWDGTGGPPVGVPIGGAAGDAPSWPGGDPLEALRALVAEGDGAAVRGLIGTARGPMMVARWPLTAGEAGAASGGALAMGRWLSDVVGAATPARSGLTVTLRPAVGTDPPAGGPAASTARDGHGGSGTDITVVPGPTPDTLRAVAVLDDVSGAPLALLRAEIPKQVTPIGWRALGIGLAVMAGASLLAILASLAVVRRMVLTPLVDLATHIRAVTSTGDLTDSLIETGRRDELGDLANAINGMRHRVVRLAYFDTLTGLPNRRLLEDRADQLLRIAHRSDQKVALLFLDLDGFKAVNDAKGHGAGDSLLQAVARGLKQMVRESDTVGRLGGDEFVVVMHNPAGRAQVEDLADRVLERFRQPFQTSVGKVFVGVSIGIALYPDDGTDLHGLLGKADAAMYQAKTAGGGRSAFLNGDQHRQAADSMDMTQAFREAIFADQLRLVYQPQVDLESGSQVRHEALIRWVHPQRGTIRAEEFIHLADSGTLFARLDAWVLRTACEALARGRGDGAALSVVAVNLSTRHLIGQDLVGLVRDALGRHDLSPRGLVLELSANSVDPSQDEAMRTLTDLRALGVGIAIDGFGAGRVALGDLRRVPATILKINRGLVRDAPRQDASVAIIRALVSLGHDLDMEVVADGVETEAQLAVVRACGCRVAQGYLLGVAS
ncbi:putative bifunctional diguanylate cyclase/phosphodiesterase [Roseospira visakhapatnamensis]|uniref:Diguanylate cyclase (GGDEF)-like protein n=1 Tax=Roseospira visakhapatnamensis TaxID=390880 RepID=A0A7W6RDY9_9PROT|nr:EAL domain-containing protein [Roseospira visakhapatnamensis]MBB4266799.1 diguanylate cyclase (GGDEF)-like protein [Roseospira visakhapatnamensis]